MDEYREMMIAKLFLGREPLRKCDIIEQLESIRAESLSRLMDDGDLGDIWADDVLALTQAINFLKTKFPDKVRPRSSRLERNRYLF